MRLLLLLLGLVVVYSDQNIDPGCADTDCGDNGVCVDSFCRCAAGWVGALCETPVEVCPGEVGPPGTGNLCFNGGLCTVAPIDGVLQNSCDCSTAVQESAFETIISYTGLQCELPATTICDPTDPEAICVNGGVCRSPGAPGCDCLPDYYGTQCELLLGDDLVDDDGNNVTDDAWDDDWSNVTIDNDDTNGNGTVWIDSNAPTPVLTAIDRPSRTEVSDRPSDVPSIAPVETVGENSPSSWAVVREVVSALFLVSMAGWCY